MLQSLLPLRFAHFIRKLKSARTKSDQGRFVLLCNKIVIKNNIFVIIHKTVERVYTYTHTYIAYIEKKYLNDKM